MRGRKLGACENGRGGRVCDGIVPGAGGGWRSGVDGNARAYGRNNAHADGGAHRDARTGGNGGLVGGAGGVKNKMDSLRAIVENSVENYNELTNRR